MQITFQPVRQTQSGFALVIVLTFLVVSLIIFASIMCWVSGNARITQRNNVFNQSESAAESATELIISTMMRDFNNLSLNPSNNYNTLLPPTNGWPVLYQFSATNGAAGLTAYVSIGPTNWDQLPAQYAGLSGLGQNCTIACTATPLNQQVSVPATVSQTVWFGTIPVFQYAVFYNVDLEVNPGAAFTISGRVHCNTNIYCTGSGPGTNQLYFLGSVDAAGNISNTPSPYDPQNGPGGGNRSGNVSYPAGQPWAHKSKLNLPLGGAFTNYSFAAIETLLQLPPAAYASGTADAYNTNGLVYFANRADLIITNDYTTGTNFTVLYQNPNNSPNYLQKVAPDTNSITTVTNISNIITNISVVTNGSGAGRTYTTNKTYTTNFNYTFYTNFYYSYVTNTTFYDYREGETVKAIQIDVSKLGAWLGNSATNYGTNQSTGGWQYELLNASGGSTDVGHDINSIYVFNSISNTIGTLPAVRLVNGAQLPTNTVPNPGGAYPAPGLGIATAQPIYVKGDYNITRDGVNFARTLGSTTNGSSLPACLIGDAVTILSTNFVDNASGGTLKPTPGSQTVIAINAACFEGIVPSNGSYYSGGLENFLRLLEDWGGLTVTYNGSIVVMFPSTYATNHWGGTYYGAPKRAWGFDPTFAQPGKLPPLCPSFKSDARSAWAYF